MNIIKIPKEIRIGSHTYKVWFDEREDDSGFIGSSLHRRHEILLNPDIHIQQKRVTFLHEALHVINECYGIRPPDEDIERLAEGIGQLLFSNLDIDFDFGNIPTRRIEGRDGPNSWKESTTNKP